MSEYLELMTEKLEFLQKALVSETDASVKFKLENDINELEKKIEKLMKKESLLTKEEPDELLEIREILEPLKNIFPQEKTKLNVLSRSGKKSDGSVPLLCYIRNNLKTSSSNEQEILDKSIKELEYYYDVNLSNMSCDEDKIHTNILRIEINPKNSEEGFELEFYLCNEDSILEKMNHTPLCLKNIKKNKGKSDFFSLLIQLLDSKKIANQNLLIEFVTEAEYLNTPFHEWLNEGIELGYEYNVTSRLKNRVKLETCKESWDGMLQKYGCLSLLFEWIDDLNSKLIQNIQSGCGVGFKKTNKSILSKINNYGVVVAILPQKEIDSELQRKICEKLKHKNFNQLPFLIKELRSEEVSITLLWEEPKRINLIKRSILNV